MYEYFKIHKTRQEWLGNKLYRVSPDTDSVICVVSRPGEEKKGRPNTIGIFFITKQSFASNVFMYTDSSNKTEFKKAFERVLQMMR